MLVVTASSLPSVEHGEIVDKKSFLEQMLNALTEEKASEEVQ